MTLDFVLLKTGLLVSFNIKFNGDPVSILWDFGDGTTQTINPNDPLVESPFATLHEYNMAGFYDVNLKVITAENELEITKTIGVAPVEFIPLDRTLSQLVQGFLPTGIDFDEDFKQVPDLILKWQLFLQPLVNIEIEVNYINNELYWPPLVNYLIAYLITYDLILEVAQRYLISLGGSSAEEGGLEVKSIRTGPTEAEWFQGSETWSEVFKDSGLFDRLQENICNLSHRLRITLEICRNLDHNTKVPSVHRKTKKKRRNIFN